MSAASGSPSAPPGPLENIQLIVNALGAADRFQVIVSSEDVTRGKPDPQVFQLACQRLGLPPRRCVVVEDAPAGVQAAVAAGTRVVGVLMHHAAEALEPADLVVETLDRLLAEQLVSLAAAGGE